MALKGRKPSADFTPNEAKYILEQIVRDGRVSRADLGTYRERMKEEAEGLLARLRALGWNETASAAAAAAVGAAVVAAAPAVARGAVTAAKRVRKLTAEQRATMQIQGQYLGRIRRFPASRRTEFQRIAKEQGREAAIKAMDAVLASMGNEGPRKRGRRRSK